MIRRRARIMVIRGNLEGFEARQGFVDVASDSVEARVIHQFNSVTTVISKSRDGVVTSQQRCYNSLRAVKVNGMNGKKVRNTVVNRPKKRFFLRNMVERYER